MADQDTTPGRYIPYPVLYTREIMNMGGFGAEMAAFPDIHVCLGTAVPWISIA